MVLEYTAIVMDSETLIKGLIEGVLQGRPLPDCVLRGMEERARIFDVFFSQLLRPNGEALPSFESVFMPSQDAASSVDFDCAS